MKQRHPLRHLREIFLWGEMTDKQYKEIQQYAKWMLDRDQKKWLL
jgi:predicted Fe-S protein YdhL (DUF1289 family)